VYISELYIDGFGLYHDVSISKMPNGLVVLLGDNESGKTTLMEFIRFVLFGPLKRGNRNTFPPLRGGSHGGRLVVILRDGTRCVLGRTARVAKVSAGDGPEEAIEPSQRLLGGLDRETYCSVFAVGLAELQGLDLLDQDAVRARLISAAAGLGTASLPLAIQETDGAMSSLLGSRAGSSVIRKILGEIRGLDTRLDELRGLAPKYAECQRRRSELDGEVRRLTQEGEHTRRRIRRLEQLIQARQHWASLCLAGQRMRERDASKDFPPQGVERLDKLKASLSSAESDAKECDDNAKRLQERITRITPDNAVLAQREGIERLRAERNALIRALTDNPGLVAAAKRAEDELSRRLRELGQDWSADKLNTADTSVATRHTVLEFGRRLDSLERDVGQAKVKLATRQEDVARAERSSTEAARTLEAITRPAEEGETAPERKLAALGHVRSALHERDVLTAKLEVVSYRLQDAASVHAALERKRAETPKPLSAWIPVGIATAGSALAVLSYVQKQWMGAILFVLVAVFSLVWALIHRRQSQTRRANFLASVKDELAKSEERGQTFQSEVASLGSRIEQANQQAATAAKTAGVELPASLPLLEDLIQDAERQRESVLEWKRAEAERDKTAAVLTEASEGLANATGAWRAADAELERTKQQWGDWLAERGFDTSVLPQAFEVVLTAVDAARTAHKSLEEANHRQAQVGEYIERTQTDIAKMVKACGKRLLADKPGAEDIDALAQALTTAEKAEAEQASLHEQSAAAKTAQERAEDVVRTEKGEIEGLIAAAKASDEEDFRRRAEQHDEWHQADEDAKNAGVALLAIAGTSQAQGDLERELAGTTALEAEDEAGRLKVKEKELSGVLSDANRKIGELNSDIGSLESDHELGEVLLERQVLEQKLQSAARRWVAVALCRHLLEQARCVYERERQPQVIQDASGYVATMTGGRYAIVAPVGENTVILEDVSHRRKEEVAWSGGLADQAYLAVRLGLAKAFGVGTEPLPIVLDEVLVKFDPTRQENVGKLLVEYAKAHQVLLFTCHPEVADRILRCAGTGESGGAQATCFRISDGQVTTAPR
jgi:uncharacterized protein YhaN